MILPILENFPFSQRDDAPANFAARARIAQVPYQMRVNPISVKRHSAAFDCLAPNFGDLRLCPLSFCVARMHAAGVLYRFDQNPTQDEELGKWGKIPAAKIPALDTRIQLHHNFHAQLLK